MKRSRRALFTLIFSVLLCIAALIIAPLLGSESLKLGDVLAHLSGPDTSAGVIFFRIRMPRVLLGLLAGGALAVSGVVFQALLRNPLATPYTLGVSAGSAFGALLVIKTGVTLQWLGFSAVQIAAFAGSLITISVVYWLARISRRRSIYAMILAGVTLGYFFSAMILILHYLADFTETHQMIRWTIGGLDITSYRALLQSYPVVLIAIFGLWAMAKPLNIISASEEMALAKGVNVQRVQKWMFVVASLITGTVVALSGPIGFIGLIVPHTLRMLGGPDHRYLIPAALCFGGGFLIIADTIARTVLSPIDLPVGIITTLLGGPFFLWLLARSR